MGKLTVEKIRAAVKQERSTRLSDGDTLTLLISRRGRAAWCQRVVINGKRRDLGLGGWPVVSLAKARQRAFANRVAIADGRDPLAERRAAQTPTFAQAIERVIAIHSEAWKDGGKTAKLWRATLREYALVPLWIAEGPESPRWEPYQVALLQAADELYRHANVSDATWSALAELLRHAPPDQYRDDRVHLPLRIDDAERVRRPVAAGR